MKVLFLVNNFPECENPYAGVFVYNQIKALSEADVDVSVLYFDFRSIRRRRKWGMSTYRYNGVKVYRYAIPCGPIQKLYIWLVENMSVKAFQKVCKCEGQFDLIHAHFTDMGLAAAKIKERFKVPYVLTEHSSTLIQEDISQGEKQVIVKAYDAADKLLAVGSVLKQKMCQYTMQQIDVVPNILPDRFCIMDDIRKEKQQFTFISVVGTLTKEKKVDLLVETFAVLYKQYPQIALKICGRGNLMEELKKTVQNMSLERAIEFLGVVDNEELPKVLNACDCFVLPSVVETFGVVYIEAAGCGLPVIAANSGGTMDIINEDNGIRIQNACVEELTCAMEKMFVDKERYISEKISDDIHKKFGEKAFVERITKIYQDMMVREDKE